MGSGLRRFSERQIKNRQQVHEKTIPGMPLRPEVKETLRFVPALRFHIKTSQIEKGLGVIRVLLKSPLKMGLCFFQLPLFYPQKAQQILEVGIARVDPEMSLNFY